MCQKTAWKSEMLQNTQDRFSEKKKKKFLLQTMEENIVHKPKWKLKGCTNTITLPQHLPKG